MSRIVADNLKQISIYKLKSSGVLDVGPKTYLQTGSFEWTRNYEGEQIITGSVAFEVDYADSSPVKIKLEYSLAGGDSTRHYAINILKSKCNYGGNRYWFECSIEKNGIYCGRRVAKLYLYESYFCCRHCLNLTYSISNASKNYREMGLLFPSDRELKIDAHLSRTNRYYYSGKTSKGAQKLLDIQLRRIAATETWVAKGMPLF